MLYVLAIQCMGLSLTTTLAGEWFNSLIFCDNIKCNTTNGSPIINAGANYICHITIIYFAQTKFEIAESFLIICLWLHTASNDSCNSMPIWLHYNYVIHNVRT